MKLTRVLRLALAQLAFKLTRDLFQLLRPTWVFRLTQTLPLPLAETPGPALLLTQAPPTPLALRLAPELMQAFSLLVVTRATQPPSLTAKLVPRRTTQLHQRTPAAEGPGRAASPRARRSARCGAGTLITSG